MLYANVRSQWTLKSQRLSFADRGERKARSNPKGRIRMGDIVFIIGLIVFFVLCVWYVAALERI